MTQRRRTPDDAANAVGLSPQKTAFLCSSHQILRESPKCRHRVAIGRSRPTANASRDRGWIRTASVRRPEITIAGPKGHISTARTALNGSVRWRSRPKRALRRGCTENAGQRFHDHAGWRKISTPNVIGDPNGKAKADGMEMSILLSSWGSSQGGSADIDGDGVIGPQHLTTLIANRGSCGRENSRTSRSSRNF